jgi:hypothetical protein
MPSPLAGSFMEGVCCESWKEVVRPGASHVELTCAHQCQQFISVNSTSFQGSLSSLFLSLSLFFFFFWRRGTGF